jgi:hypothetical protein
MMKARGAVSKKSVHFKTYEETDFKLEVCLHYSNYAQAVFPFDYDPTNG